MHAIRVHICVNILLGIIQPILSITTSKDTTVIAVVLSLVTLVHPVNFALVSV